MVIVHELAEGLLRLSHAYGLEGQAEDLDRLAIDTPPFGLVAAGGHPVILAASGDPAAAGRAACRVLGFRAFAGFPLMAADGTLLAVLSFASFSRDGFAPADLDLLATVAHDVAAVRDRLRVARILAESEAFAASVIENSPDRIEVLDLDGRLVSVNSHSRRALGLMDADRLSGVNWIGAWPAESRPDIEGALAAARAGATGRFAATGSGPAENPVSWDVAVAPIPGPDGRPRLLLATARDVTVRMTQERDLRAREATLSAVLDALPVGVIIADAQGRILRDNAANRAIWGVPPETRDWSGYADWEAYWPGTGKRIQAHEWAMARALLRGEVVQDELVEYQPFSGGPRRLYLNNAAPVRDETGAIVGGVVAELDVTERYATEQALREASERLDLALEAGAILGTWIWDLRADRFTADERFARVFDLDARACHDGVAIADVLPSVHPEDLPGLVRAIDAVVRRGGAYAHQYRVRQQGDGYRWIEANGRVEMDADGVPLRFPGVLLDIAERKRAEEKQRLLAREVDHRAKNALAVVATVVRATRAEDQAAFVEAVEGRISALARAHRLLANAGWTGADLASLVADELDPFTGADRERTRIEGPPVMLAPDAVQPMAMILHELATNAAKYGALSRPTGWLVLSWRRDDRQGLDIRWHEEGGPPLDGPPTRRGFGSEMLAAAAGQLGGPAHFVWDPAGLRCLLTVARENLVLA
nr:PAS domain-containing protein [Oleisolibacter albus]